MLEVSVAPLSQTRVRAVRGQHVKGRSAALTQGKAPRACEEQEHFSLRSFDQHSMNDDDCSFSHALT